MPAKRSDDCSVAVYAYAVIAVLALAAASPTIAQGRRDEGRFPRDPRSTPDRPPRPYDSPPRGFEPPPRFSDAPLEATVKTGFLFLDGEYVAPPYEIRYADESVTVNGRKLTCIPPP